MALKTMRNKNRINPTSSAHLLPSKAISFNQELCIRASYTYLNISLEYLCPFILQKSFIVSFNQSACKDIFAIDQINKKIVSVKNKRDLIFKYVLLTLQLPSYNNRVYNSIKVCNLIQAFSI